MAGYSGYSKSNNAVIAENIGRFPITHAARIVAKEAGITIKAARELLTEIGPCEWHHTSKFYNSVNYYDADEVVRLYTHMIAAGLKSMEDAREDLDRIDMERIDAVETAKREQQQTCDHEWIPVMFQCKKRDGGGEYVHHYRCAHCQATK